MSSVWVSLLAAALSALVAAAVAFVVTHLNNKAQTARLIAQLDAERDRQVRALSHDALERERERQMAMRRTTYFDAIQVIQEALSTVSHVGNLVGPVKGSAHRFDNVQRAIAIVDVVGSEPVRAAAYKFMSSLLQLNVQIEEAVRPARIARLELSTKRKARKVATMSLQSEMNDLRRQLAAVPGDARASAQLARAVEKWKETVPPLYEELKAALTAFQSAQTEADAKLTAPRLALAKLVGELATVLRTELRETGRSATSTALPATASPAPQTT